MQQIIEIVFDNEFGSHNQRILADVIGGLGIVILPPPYEDMGLYQLYHVASGYAMGNATKRINAMRLRRAILDAFKGADWSKVSPKDMSELGDYQPTARYLVWKHTGRDV